MSSWNHGFSVNHCAIESHSFSPSSSTSGFTYEFKSMVQGRYIQYICIYYYSKDYSHKRQMVKLPVIYGSTVSASLFIASAEPTEMYLISETVNVTISSSTLQISRNVGATGRASLQPGNTVNYNSNANILPLFYIERIVLCVGVNDAYLSDSSLST